MQHLGQGSIHNQMGLETAKSSVIQLSEIQKCQVSASLKVETAFTSYNTEILLTGGQPVSITSLRWLVL